MLLVAGLLVVTALLAHAALAPSSTLFGAVLSHGPAGAGRVALTFDDGPDPVVTPLVLDALAAAGARATFFVLGERACRHPELLRRIHAEGHQVENHSFAHRPLPFSSRAAIHDDLRRTQEAVVAAGLPRPASFRPPFGFRDPRVLAVARELDLETVTWSLSPRDWREPGAATIARRVLSAVGDGAVVLLHDGAGTGPGGRPQTAAALPALLAGLAGRGLSPVRLDELVHGATTRGAHATGDH